MSSLETLAAQMVMRAHQVERALHDPGPWKVRVDGVGHPARRVIGEDHITFFVFVPSAQSDTIELTCRGDIVAVAEVPSSREGFQISWEFHVDDPVAA